METLIISIGLKMVEIGGLYVICWICHLVGSLLITHEDDDLSVVMFMRTLLGAIIIFGVSLGMLLLYFAVIANWQWAVRLTN